MELRLKKNEKLTKIFTLILGGILILIVIMPVKNTVENTREGEKAADEAEKDYVYYANYYEEKLKKILEQSYGEGTMEVMVRVSADEKENSFYNDSGDATMVEGVIVVADVPDAKALSDISFAVCALFDLPAHKVAVMIKN